MSKPEESIVELTNPLYAKDGLLYRNGKLIELPEADRVAQEYGYQYAEQLVLVLVLTKSRGHTAIRSHK